MLSFMATEGVEVKSRVRVPIRVRENQSTLAAWRVELKLPEGVAAVVYADLGSGRSWYRGEGALLGAPQERLAALWTESLPDTDPDSPFQQFG
jgi:hypothetical protein